MNQVAGVVNSDVLTLFGAISLLASVASLVLSGVAIWLAIRFKTDADNVNHETLSVLSDIRSDAKAIAAGVMSELRAYGEWTRGTIARNNMTAPGITTSTSQGLQVTSPAQGGAGAGG